jgi:hypothetical protein
MNNEKTIENARPVGGDYFRLIYVRKSNKKLEDYLNKFNPDDYWIYKSSNKQREVTYEEFLEFKYSGYIFFKKDIYNKENIDLWIDFLYKFGNGGTQYLNKPLPPFNPNKIIIKK